MARIINLKEVQHQKRISEFRQKELDKAAFYGISDEQMARIKKSENMKHKLSVQNKKVEKLWNLVTQTEE